MPYIMMSNIDITLSHAPFITTLKPMNIQNQSIHSSSILLNPNRHLINKHTKKYLYDIFPHHRSIGLLHL
jgi:hypothetical protein